MNSESKIAVQTDERDLRALVRESIRIGVAVTQDEEQAIEDELIRLLQERCGLRPPDELDKLLGYQGSIQCTPLDNAIDEQRSRLWEVQAIVDVTAEALNRHFGDWPAGVPNFPKALEQTSRMIDVVTDALDAGTLEDRALEIARGMVGVDEEAATS